jgi:hypothetical protein
MVSWGRLHVSDSVYELPYDSVHDLHTKGLGFRLSFGHQLQLIVNTFLETSVKKLIAKILSWESYTESYAHSYA